MLFPRSYAFTRTQRSLILADAIVALASLGAFIYSYERYHSPASESILYGTWQIQRARCTSSFGLIRHFR
jgi:hypothetical protein